MMSFDADELTGGLARRFQAVVEAQPDFPAIICEDQIWSYRDLGHAAAEIAERITDAGVAPGGRVALHLGHTPVMVAACLGALAAGTAYVPIDPDLPPDRKAAILADCDAGLLLTDGSSGTDPAAPGAVKLTEDVFRSGRRLNLLGSGESVAYLIYTSGTTGVPKGVIQTQANVLHHIRVYAQALGIQPGDRLSLLPRYCYDAAVMDIYGAVLNGAALVLHDLRAWGIPGLWAWADRAGITILHTTPTVFRAAAAFAVPGQGHRIRMVVLGGEPALAGDLDAFKAVCRQGAVLVNGLGPTEATLALQAFFDHDSTVDGRMLPVGRPVPGMQADLVATDGAADGGELELRSRHLAPGYWKNPQLTADRFRTADPENGLRAYRTGDILRRCADGSFVFVARMGLEVKVRGVKVDLGEIEHHARTLPGIRDCKVFAIERRSRSFLVCVHAGNGPEGGDAGFRRHLSRSLPDSHLPHRYVRVDPWPVKANGKVDQEILLRVAEQAFDERKSEQGRAGAMGGSERDRPPAESDPVADAIRIFEDLTGTAGIAPGSVFFDIGGDSLMIAELILALERAWGVRLPMREIVRDPTPAGLATALDRIRGKAAPDGVRQRSRMGARSFPAGAS